MNDESREPHGSYEPSTSDPIERELSERLARGDDAPVQDTDPAELREASAWVEHLDALVTDIELRATPADGTAPDPISVRDAVLARVVHGPRATRGATPRRSPAPRPWWQAAAPFVVACGLAALFIWQQRSGSGDPLPAAPSAIEALEAPPQARLSTALDAQDAQDPAEDVQEKAGRAERDGSDARSGLRVLEGAPLERSMAIAPAPTVHAEAESLLALLERGSADPHATLQMRTRLLALRAAIADTALAARIDRSLARHPPEPR